MKKSKKTLATFCALFLLAGIVTAPSAQAGGPCSWGCNSNYGCHLVATACAAWNYGADWIEEW
ncbi:MAG: hypothetical protein WAW75_08365 [Gallionella sp.]